VEPDGDDEDHVQYPRAVAPEVAVLGDRAEQLVGEPHDGQHGDGVRGVTQIDDAARHAAQEAEEVQEYAH